MTGGAVLKVASAGVTRRLVPSVVIFLVLTAGAAAGLLGLTLVTNSNELFLTAFARQHGAQLAVTFNAAKVTPAQLAKTRLLPGVTRAAGPYPETFVLLAPGHTVGGPPVPRANSRLTVPHGQVNAGAVAPGKPIGRDWPGQVLRIARQACAAAGPVGDQAGRDRCRSDGSCHSRSGSAALSPSPARRASRSSR